MRKRQIVNIINFIRDVEPRTEMDLVTPVAEQIGLLEKYNLKGTFLLQYDALMDPVYVKLLKEHASENIETGAWLEIVQPLAEKAGIKWRGRFPWDWHSHVGFSVGYTLSEREKLLDVFMEDFKAVFGAYPKSMGSWTIDAHSLAYLYDKYGLVASCNCKDQLGTDGYTIWGGYYFGAYYPSRKNMHCPAQSAEQQLNLPVFRMLGSDLLYQYDSGLDFQTGKFRGHGVVTLEPVYTGAEGGGGRPEWVDWYLRENFNAKCLSYAYTQAGQENSFGWKAMGKGLTYQIEKIAEMAQKGEVEVLTLAESGEWFKNTFSETPAVTGVVENDWRKQDRRTVWYNCKNYRINLYGEKGRFWIRDCYLFNENYPERYFDEVCKTEFLQFDTLPLVDGVQWGGNGIRSGFYPFCGGQALSYASMDYSEIGETAVTTFSGTQCGDMKFICSPEKTQIKADGDFSFKLLFDKNPRVGMPEIKEVQNGRITFVYRNFEYGITIAEGVIGDDYTIHSQNGTITVVFAEKRQKEIPQAMVDDDMLRGVAQMAPFLRPHLLDKIAAGFGKHGINISKVVELAQYVNDDTVISVLENSTFEKLDEKLLEKFIPFLNDESKEIIFQKILDGELDWHLLKTVLPYAKYMYQQIEAAVVYGVLDQAVLKMLEEIDWQQ